MIAPLNSITHFGKNDPNRFTQPWLSSGSMDLTSSGTPKVSDAPAAMLDRLPSAEILRILDDSLCATVSVVDRDLRFRYVTAGFAQAFNLTWQQMMGMSVHDVYPDAEFDKFFPYLQRVLAGESVSYERLGRIHQHENVWRSVSLNPWRDKSGAVIGFVHSSLEVHQLKTTTEALRLANEQLRILALHDQLTGLPNRHSLHERLGTALTRAARSHHPVALLFIDLDGFKQVNDKFGHAAGDEVLCEVARRLLLAVRETDVVARFGGDEFLVLLDTEVHSGTPDVVCNRILASLAAPCKFSNGQAVVGASIGVAMHPPLPDHADGLIGRADAAMYVAKQAGKGCVQHAGV